MGAFALPMMIASTVMQGVSILSQGRQAKAAADYEAKVADQNAKNEAFMARDRADKIRKMARAQQSEARAALAGSGVKTGEGSAVVINQKIGQDGELDALTELMTGRSRAASYMQQAEISRVAGRNAQSASYIRATGSVLSGGARIADAWLRNQSERPARRGIS